LLGVLPKSIKNDSYVYEYSTPEGIPFYIGKGQNNRVFAHLNDAQSNKFDSHNPIKSGILRSILNDNKSPKIKILVIGDEKYCFAVERSLIKKYGRICNDTGCLANIAEGGEGSSDAAYLGGLATRKKYSKSHYAKILAKGRKALMKKYGKDAYKIIMSKGLKRQKEIYGDNYSDEMKRRSALGNSNEANQKKKITRIKNYGNLDNFYKETQTKRKATMKKRGGWSVKCFNLLTNKWKIVKQEEFKLNPNLVGNTSKQIPQNYK